MLNDLSPEEASELRRRWRMILGPEAEEPLCDESPGNGGEASPGGSGENDGGSGRLLDDRDRQRDGLLVHLYGREHQGRTYGDDGPRRGCREASRYTVPRWLSGIRTLFPRSTVETLQRQALERYGMYELLTDPEMLQHAPADMDTVRVLMQFRSMLGDRALAQARRLIRKVVAELEERLARRVRNAILGPRLRQQHGGAPTLANLDWHTTLRRNLKHYRPELGVIVPERFWFWRRHSKKLPWDLILLVDQSGSMLDSVINSAVLAAIFYGLQTLRARLVLFDTRVVDVSERIGDPVEVMCTPLHCLREILSLG